MIYVWDCCTTFFLSLCRGIFSIFNRFACSSPEYYTFRNYKKSTNTANKWAYASRFCFLEFGDYYALVPALTALLGFWGCENVCTKVQKNGDSLLSSYMQKTNNSPHPRYDIQKYCTPTIEKCLCHEQHMLCPIPSFLYWSNEAGVTHDKQAPKKRSREIGEGRVKETGVGAIRAQ